ncbi:MAG: enoyl-CoA hydratase, partial [Candidatus Binatus sp.]
MANETAQKNLIVEEDAGLVTLTMNRPEKRNALSTAMMTELNDALHAIGKRSDARAVIIAGNGPAFSAGHDLGELKGRDLAFYRYEFDLCAQLMLTIQAIPQPVIARVHAIATAAGCQLAATCDLVVAGESASFATPGVRIGLFCSTPMVALSRNVSRKHAMEMLLTGELISAEDAARIGLVNHVVAPGHERAAALKLAEKIAAKSTLTVKIGKKAFYRQAEMPLAEAYKYASEVMVENMLARDAE